MVYKSKRHWTAGGLSLGGLLGVWVLLGVQAEAMATMEWAILRSGTMWDTVEDGEQVG